MSCPICGDRCTCERSGAELHTSILIDPELPESSEEQFEASLSARGRTLLSHRGSEVPGAPAQVPPSDLEPWRHEVASRVNAFCARRGRKREPRLPSMSFDFEPAARTSGAEAGGSPRSNSALAHQIEQPVVAEPEPSNVIEFPRPLIPAPPRPPVQLPLDELAEPVIQTPRILEAEPEHEGLQFGGQPMPSITLDAPAPPSVATFPTPAVLSHRAVAGALDALVVLVATGAFAGIVAKITGDTPSNRAALVTAVGVTALLWAAYEYIFWVYGGATVGMRVTRLELRTFDCAQVPRGKRRWRAIAMMISAMSLGIGFLWAVIDEDGLCWHDRISRTLLRPR